MTLVIALLCDDGAVIAADRQVTHGALGRKTVGQAGTKVEIVEDKFIFASSGPISLSQEIQDAIAGVHDQFLRRDYSAIRSILKKKIKEIAEGAFETAGKAAPVIGPQAAAMDAICGAVFAAEFKDGLRLVEISPQANFEALSDSVPFVCLGTGKPNADPFLAFLRSVYWPDKLPNIEEALTAAYWTIKFVTELGTEGVGLGTEAIMLKRDGTSYIARTQDEKTQIENDEFIFAAVDKLRSVQRAPSDDDAEPPEVADDDIPTLGS